MPTEKQKASRNKWDAEHMKVIGCKIRAEEAEKFKQFAKKHETTVNALFLGFIRKCLSEDETSSQN